jgi:hypothetical protein
MQFAKNKTTNTTFAIILMLTIAVTLVALPTANAHTPAWTVPTWSYLTISPDPCGIDQTAILVFTVNWVPPGAGGPQGDRKRWGRSRPTQSEVHTLITRLINWATTLSSSLFQDK